MSDRPVELDALDAAFEHLGFPAEFLARYDQMECLSSHRGRETFLVRRVSDGALAVAKCYDRAVYGVVPAGMDATEGLDFPGLPHYLGRFENDRCVCFVREYIAGVSLADHVRENAMEQREIVSVCVRLTEILQYLHSRPQPIIHRDVKPENVILAEDGSVFLIDFDIARTYKSGAESDTMFFGTKGYAPPEQYGFAQTDARTDVFSMGVLLRFLLTGSIRENKNIRIYRPLERIIARCTALVPEKRYQDMNALKRALLAANPRTQLLRALGLAFAALALCAALALGGVKLYRTLTYSPFTPDVIPAFTVDAERIADAYDYLRARFGATFFDERDANDIVTVGDLRRALMELYGLERDYVYGFNEEMPQESERFFLPWGWDDGQFLARDVAIYAVVKAYDPALVADWSSLKDDDGFYPGVRVAVAFAEETGLATGVNHPMDITIGELALLIANADRVFAAAREASN